MNCEENCLASIWICYLIISHPNHMLNVLEESMLMEKVSTFGPFTFATLQLSTDGSLGAGRTPTFSSPVKLLELLRSGPHYNTA